MIDLAQQIVTQSCPITLYQLKHLQAATIKILQPSATTIQVAYLQSIMDAISEKNFLFTKNFIFIFQNTNNPIVKFNIAKILNEKIFNFWQIWRKQSQCEVEQIFSLVVNNIISYLSPHQNKQLFEDKIILQLNKSFKIIYRHEWKYKLNGVLIQICDPRENSQYMLKNNLKVARLIFEDATETSFFLVSDQRFQFMNNIKKSAQSILVSISLMLTQLDKFKQVIKQVVKLLPSVLTFINSDMFLSNYSSLTDNLIIIYCGSKEDDIDIKTDILESLQLIMSFPTNNILFNLISNIDRKFVQNIKCLLDFQIKSMKLTKIKQKNNAKTNPYTNSEIKMTSPRKTLSFFDQQKITNNELIHEIVQNFYCSQEVTQKDEHILQVIQAFLMGNRKIQVKATNQTSTEAQVSEKSNIEVLKKMIQNLIKFEFWMALKLQNQNSVDDLVNTQRRKLFLLEIIKLTLAFSNNNQIFLPAKAKLQVCSMLICNLSTCPSYFWHSYAIANVLSKVNVQDQSNFNQIIDTTDDIFPIVWKYLSPQYDLILNFVIEKLDYYIKLSQEVQTEKRPDRILGINRLVWGVKHLMNSSSGYLKIADKVHYKLQMLTDSVQSPAITKFATKFCWPLIQKNQEQQSTIIQILFKELDSLNSYTVEFYSLIMRQIMEKVFCVSQSDISIFLDRFQNLIFYQDKNQRNLVLLPCLLQFLKKMEDPNIEQLHKYCKRIIEICLGQEKQYPQRRGFIKIQCLTWIIKQFFTFLDQADQMLQDQNKQEKSNYQVNNKQWTQLVCYQITKQIEIYVIKIFQQFKAIQQEVFSQGMRNNQENADSFLKSESYKKYDEFVESYIDFVVSYSRTWKTYLTTCLKENENVSHVQTQLKTQQNIMIQIIVHAVNNIDQYDLNVLNHKIFKLFAVFLQFYCDILVTHLDLMPYYKERVNQIIIKVYSVTNPKIKTQKDSDFGPRINYYQFFERILTNQNIFYVLKPQTVKLAISDILIKVCLDDQIQVVETGVFILQKLFLKIIGVKYQSNIFYQQIWNSIVPITSAVFQIMLITPGRLYFQEISAILLHLFQVISRSSEELFALNNNKLSNWQNLILIFQTMLRKEYFADQECLSQNIKQLVASTFSQQQITLFRQKLKDLLIMTKMRTTRAKLDMEDIYQ